METLSTSIDTSSPEFKQNTEHHKRLADELMRLAVPRTHPGIILRKNKIIRMGLSPVMLEPSTSISGVDFDACYENRIVAELDGVSPDHFVLKGV